MDRPRWHNPDYSEHLGQDRPHGGYTPKYTHQELDDILAQLAIQASSSQVDINALYVPLEHTFDTIAVGGSLTFQIPWTLRSLVRLVWLAVTPMGTSLTDTAVVDFAITVDDTFSVPAFRAVDVTGNFMREGGALFVYSDHSGQGNLNGFIFNTGHVPADVTVHLNKSPFVV